MDPLTWAAPLAALAYVGISLAVGERFPFSRYVMYAGTATREKAAVPLLLADNKPAFVDDYDRYSGIDTAGLYPPGLACSLEWQIHEARRWISEHPASPGDSPGPVAVTWGFVILRVDERGRIQERWRPVAEGRAWPR